MAPDLLLQHIKFVDFLWEQKMNINLYDKNNSKSKKVSVGVLFTLLLTLFVGHLNQDPVTSADFASEIAKNTQRDTVLPPILPVRKHKKEKDLLDPAISKMWGLQSVQAIKAWNQLNIKGDRKIIVAVIDTGIDTKHPDLQKNLWVNTKEIPGNGKDDDMNGCIDDVHGCNFISNKGDIKDNHGHGSHIAGIIGATHGNGVGISGVAPNVSMMILKYYDPRAPGINNLVNTVKAIKYAVKQGAHIINYSGGGLEASPAERKAIEEARKKGILFVAAAGNEKSNSDIHGYYPADYKMSNIISVTAINKNKYVLPSSNYGAASVDVAAPGNNILSTLPGGQYGKMTGTSQATAFVTGVAALIMSRFPDFTPSKVIKHLTQTGDFDQRLSGKTKHKKRLNTYRALTILDSGVGVTGIVAKNMQNSPETKFSIESTTDRSTSATDETGLASFVKRMKKEISKNVKTADK